MNPAGLFAILRTWRRAQLAAGGIAALAVVAIVLASLGGTKPGPGPGPGDSLAAAASPGVSLTLASYALPRPSRTDVVLVVGAADALTDRETAWLADLRQQYGAADPVAAKDATLDKLLGYLTIFVIDAHDDLDVAVLRGAFAEGMTVNLAGGAAAYRTQVLASPAP